MNKPEQIKAIETRYKGYLFRSRLEARWAVFFDTLGIKWEYEPEGFEKTVGGQVLRYLPDFWLPELEYWAEVKGTMTDRDAILISNFPELFSRANNGSNRSNGIIVLGNIPEPNPCFSHFHRCVRLLDHDFGESCWVMFYTNVKPTIAVFHGSFMIGDKEIKIPAAMYWNPSDSASFSKFAPTSLFTSEVHTADLFAASMQIKEDVLAAYTAARSARFEHGQSGGAA